MTSSTAPGPPAGTPATSGSSTPTSGAPAARPRDGAASRSSWPWSTRSRWASSSPTTSPGWPAIAPTGISYSTYADIGRCLVGDQDGIYDPATPNGRLILGLKGLISELELHTLRARLTAGLLNKARRGELALSLPIGLVRDALGRVLKHPDQEVQDRLDLVFTTFLRIKAACRVVQLFNDRDLLLPRRDRFGDLVWRRPTASAILSILKNPAYAGAFVYGRTRAVPRADAPHQRVQKPLPMDRVEGLPPGQVSGLHRLGHF